MGENEYKDLNSVHLETVKELSRIVKERADLKVTGDKALDETLLNTIKELSKIVKVQEQVKASKCETRYKYIAISVIAVALLVVIFLCCNFEQRNCKNDFCENRNKVLELKQSLSISDTVKVYILKEEQE